jgi:hypothetical protein
VNIHGSYYKNQNPEKWDEIFEDDQEFMNFLIKFHSNSFFCSCISPISKNSHQLKKLELIPWNQKLAKKLSGCFRKIGLPPQMKVNLWVKLLDEDF